MAKGFGTFHSSNYHSATSLTGTKCSAVVSQTVNSTARTVTVKVHAEMSFYRISSTWNLVAGDDISKNPSSSYYVQATLNGSSSSKSVLGIEAKKAFSATAGNTYTQAAGYIQAISGYNCYVEKSETYNYNDNGDAITKSWSAKVYYGGTTMTVSGSVTTDSIDPAYSNPEGLDASISSKTDTSAIINVSVTSYGNPASASGRYLRGAVLGSSTYGNPYRYTDASNVSSASVLVDNSSSMGTTTLNITGNTEYYYGAYANNTQKSVNIVKGTFVTLPAYITSVGSVDNGHGSITFTVNHNAEGSAYTVQNQYSLDQTTWTNMSNSVTLSLADTTTVYFRRTSTAGTTPVVSKTVTPFFNRFVYVGVGGVSKKSKKIYVGVNGQSKLVKKIYVGVNGQSKLVYKSS